MSRQALISIFTIVILAVGGTVFAKLRPRQFKLPKDKSMSSAQLKHSIPLDQILEGGPGKDGIPSIDHPKFISLNQAKGQLKDEGLGLAVSLNGEDRFYPYQILVWHELVNDQVGNTPILVSFCPLCGSGIVFERKLDDQAVEFGVSGKLYNSDLLMYDRKTDSLWSQILGEAVVGELTGTKLAQINVDVIQFKIFSQKFPNGKVLSKDTGFSRSYDKGPYGNYDQSSGLYFPVSKQDNRLHPKTRVLGVEVNGKFKAYPVEKLEGAKRISDQLGGHTLVLEYNDGLVNVQDTTSSQKVIPVNNFWFAWFAFHPDTELYQ